ncbi:MAG: YhjD/YihY/BrkB family envelope integrity protein [Rubrobacteraceae bacterium]
MWYPTRGCPSSGSTPGGFVATFLMFGLSVGLSLYVANPGNCGRIYGQLGAVIVLMI